MAPETVETKIQALEEHVTRLEQLPERMDRLESQFLQLRTEMHAEFSAAREDIRAGDEETRRFMLVLHEKVIGDIALLGEAGGPRAREGPKKAKP